MSLLLHLSICCRLNLLQLHPVLILLNGINVHLIGPVILRTEPKRIHIIPKTFCHAERQIDLCVSVSQGDYEINSVKLSRSDLLIRHYASIRLKAQPTACHCERSEAIQLIHVKSSGRGHFWWQKCRKTSRTLRSLIICTARH